MKKEEAIQEQPKKTSGWIIAGAVFLTMLIVCGGFMFMFGSYVAGTYNLMVSQKQDIGSQWSNMKVDYQRRADLFYNVAEVAKSYAKFESTTMIGIAEGRSGHFGNTKQEEAATMQQMDAASTSIIGNFVKLQEAYPELRTIEQYNTLLGEIQSTENTIRVDRVNYNSLVKKYNQLILKFPDLFVAKYFGFTQETYFENEASTNAAPKLDMGN